MQTLHKVAAASPWFLRTEARVPGDTRVVADDDGITHRGLLKHTDIGRRTCEGRALLRTLLSDHLDSSDHRKPKRETLVVKVALVVERSSPCNTPRSCRRCRNAAVQQRLEKTPNTIEDVTTELAEPALALIAAEVHGTSRVSGTDFCANCARLGTVHERA